MIGIVIVETISLDWDYNPPIFNLNQADIFQTRILIRS